MQSLMPLEKPLIAMSNLADCTLDREWCAKQTDRLLAFEILTRTLRGDTQPVEPGALGDKVALDKGISYRIIKNLQCKLTNKRP